MDSSEGLQREVQRDRAQSPNRRPQHRQQKSRRGGEQYVQSQLRAVSSGLEDQVTERRTHAVAAQWDIAAVAAFIAAVVAVVVIDVEGSVVAGNKSELFELVQAAKDFGHLTRVAVEEGAVRGGDRARGSAKVE